MTGTSLYHKVLIVGGGSAGISPGLSVGRSSSCGWSSLRRQIEVG